MLLCTYVSLPACCIYTTPMLRGFAASQLEPAFIACGHAGLIAVGYTVPRWHVQVLVKEMIDAWGPSGLEQHARTMQQAYAHRAQVVLAAAGAHHRSMALPASPRIDHFAESSPAL